MNLNLVFDDSNKACVPKLRLGMHARGLKGPAQHAMTHAIGAVKVLVMLKQGTYRDWNSNNNSQKRF